MKTAKLHPADWLYGLSFLLYLVGSSLAHIESGTELSLWLITFAITFTSATTLLPLAGIRWLRLEPRGSRSGYWIAMLLLEECFTTGRFLGQLWLGHVLPPGQEPGTLSHIDHHLRPRCCGRSGCWCSVIAAMADRPDRMHFSNQ